MSMLTAHIDGMSCNHCLDAVNSALGSVPGVRIASVRLGRAEVELLPDGGATSDAVVMAIEEAGYNVAHVETSG